MWTNYFIDYLQWLSSTSYSQRHYPDLFALWSASTWGFIEWVPPPIQVIILIASFGRSWPIHLHQMFVLWGEPWGVRALSSRKAGCKPGQRKLLSNHSNVNKHLVVSAFSQHSAPQQYSYCSSSLGVQLSATSLRIRLDFAPMTCHFGLGPIGRWVRPSLGGIPFDQQ